MSLRRLMSVGFVATATVAGSLAPASAADTLTPASVAAGRGVAATAAAPKVTAVGDAPAVAASVVSVEAPFAMTTSAGDRAARTKVLTAQQAAAGTVWTDVAKSATDCPDAGLPAAEGLTPSAVNVLNCEVAAYPDITEYLGVGHRSANGASDHPNGRAVDAMIDNWQTPAGKTLGWDLADYLVENRRALNIKYVIWDAQINTGSGWRPYRHPSGASDPNSAHLNHVHVSVRG